MTRLLPLLLVAVALWAWTVVDLADNATPENPPAEHVVTDHQPDPWATFAEPPAPTVHATSAHHPTVTQQRKRTTAPTDDVWDRLAQCESGGRWNLNVGGHEGGLQFLHSTWVRAGGRRYAEHAYQATREQQIDIARTWLARTSWTQWPVCSKKLGLR